MNSETRGRTYWEYINEKRASNYSSSNAIHCVFCSLQELVLVGLNVHAIGHFHDERPGHTENRSNLGRTVAIKRRGTYN